MLTLAKIFQNQLICLSVFQYLKNCLSVLCEKVIKKQHSHFLIKLPKIQESCHTCTHKTIISHTRHKTGKCHCVTNQKCLCLKNPRSRKQCPQNFCSKLFDYITISHRFKNPNWDKCDPSKWNNSFWSIAVCFINTPGYHDKDSVKETDVRGLLSIVINNLEFEKELDGISIDSENSNFRVARDFVNWFHHAVIEEVNDEKTKYGINVVKNLLQELAMQQKEEHIQTVLENFKKDEVLAAKFNASPIDLFASGIGEESESYGDECAAGGNRKELSNLENGEKIPIHVRGSKQKFLTVPPPRYPRYANLCQRIQSFGLWIHRTPTPEECAKAGFFFTNNNDLVKCYRCGIGLKDFSEGDNPLIEHIRYSGSCPYLLEYLGAERITEIKRQLQISDTVFCQRSQWSERYRHPEYQTLQSRLATFTSWSYHTIQTPQQLAEAGLFYTGLEDLVRCFACDGGLRRWDPEDDPWTEHCKWFPACPFVRIQKGDDYIAFVASANQENSGSLSAALEGMEVRDSALLLDNIRDACLEMGYQLEDFNEAVKELRMRGLKQPLVEEIIDSIEVIIARRTQDGVSQNVVDETPAEENRRLKNINICMTCGKNRTNCLFLPCTHHRVCMECAQPLVKCPVCDKNIRQKIRTFLV